MEHNVNKEYPGTNRKNVDKILGFSRLWKSCWLFQKTMPLNALTEVLVGQDLSDAEILVFCNTDPQLI